MARRQKYIQKIDKWRARTNAAILTVAEFEARKRDAGYHVLGVMGFAGAWSRSGQRGAALEALVKDARTAMTDALEEHKRTHGDKLVVSTGGTNAGVLEVTYTACADLGILAMAVTPDQTLAYPIGEVNFLIPVGRRYGDESEAFLDTSDALLLMGGGPQSREETLQGLSRGMPITVIQGFGGCADAFTPDTLPGARFIQRPG